MLSDRLLLQRLAHNGPQRIEVDPFSYDTIQPCSIDVHLGDVMKVFIGKIMDTGLNSPRDWAVLRPERNGVWLLERGKFYLGVLAERLYIPTDLAGELRGVSTRARQGIVIHQQAGHLDPGYCGHPTLEITTVAADLTVLRPGCRIGQITFQQIDGAVLTPYQGRYQGGTGPQPPQARARHEVA